MVNDVECGDTSENQKFGDKPFAKDIPSIAECWRWMKGLLYDFINLKKDSFKMQAQIEKTNQLNKQLKYQMQKMIDV